ncbi:MFS transporter, ACS family, allantoate permease, partial [Phenoliferia sp. Uapishka_3]
LDTTPSPDVLSNAGRSSSSKASKTSASSSTTTLPTMLSSLSLNDGASSSAPSLETKATSIMEEEEMEKTRTVFLNEQTSHHPPISFFHLESRGPKGTVRATGADQVGAKFTGTTVKVFPGEHNKGIFVTLPDRNNEEYQRMSPVFFAVLPTPQSARTVTSHVVMAQSVYAVFSLIQKRFVSPILACSSWCCDIDIDVFSSSLQSWLMKSKFLLEGVVYEYEEGKEEAYTKIKQVPASQVVATIEGCWRGEVRWKRAGEKSWSQLLDMVPLSVIPKTVAPLDQQHELETRKVWSSVTNAILAKDWNAASKAKQALEQAQRVKAEERKKSGEPYLPVYFGPQGDEWDGRPVLTEEGRKAVEKEFKARYEGPQNNYSDDKMKDPSAVTVAQVKDEFEGPGPEREVVDLGEEVLHGEHVEYSQKEENAVFRKIDKRLIPLLMWVYMIQFGDKISLGYASLMGIQTDLKLHGREYSWASSVFYAGKRSAPSENSSRLALILFLNCQGFLLAEFPAVYLLKKLPIGTFTSVNIMLWGLVLSCTAAVSSYGGLVTVRFLLGVFEAPITPAFLMLTAMWYPRYQQGRRVSYFLACNGIATLICAPIAFGLSGITSDVLETWKILFILFGIITFLTGLAYIFFMPNNVATVKWLSPREKAIAIDSVNVHNNAGVGNYVFRWYQVREAFCDPRTYLYFFFSLIMNIPNVSIFILPNKSALTDHEENQQGGVTSFGNLVIKGFGFDSRHSLLLGMPGGFVDLLFKLVLMNLSDRFQDRTVRSFAMVAISFPFMGGLIMLLGPQTNRGVLLFGYYCISAAGAGWGLMMVLISNNSVVRALPSVLKSRSLT